MNNLLNAGQVQLGNVIFADNYRGEEVIRRVVGGAYGTVTKFFLTDEAGNLKSRKRDTIEEVLEGFKIKSISATTEMNNPHGEVSLDIEDVNVGDLLIIDLDGEKAFRFIVGGHSYGEDIYFTVDINTGKRTSRTNTSIEAVLEGYVDEDGISKVVAVIKG